MDKRVHDKHERKRSEKTHKDKVDKGGSFYFLQSLVFITQTENRQ